MKTRILLVEDDPALRKLLKDALPESIFVIDIAETGREGLDMIVKRKPDLILLDWNLPDLNGFEVCKYIKQNKDCAHIPIIMVTAYSELNRKVSALDVGADDYITKPFEIEELIARVKAVLRRRQGGAPEEAIAKANITLNLTTYTVEVDKKPIILTAKEFDLLYVLMKNAGRILTREFCWSASGAMPWTSPRARSTSISAACARRWAPKTPSSFRPSAGRLQI